MEEVEEVDCIQALEAQRRQHKGNAVEQNGASPQQGPQSFTAGWAAAPNQEVRLANLLCSDSPAKSNPHTYADLSCPFAFAFLPALGRLSFLTHAIRSTA